MEVLQLRLASTTPSLFKPTTSSSSSSASSVPVTVSNDAVDDDINNKTSHIHTNIHTVEASQKENRKMTYKNNKTKQKGNKISFMVDSNELVHHNQSDNESNENSDDGDNVDNEDQIPKAFGIVCKKKVTSTTSTHYDFSNNNTFFKVDNIFCLFCSYQLLSFCIDFLY